MQMARRIADFAGLDATLLEAQSGAHPQRRAVRPGDVSLLNLRTRAELKTRMLDFDSALKLVFDR